MNKLHLLAAFLCVFHFVGVGYAAEYGVKGHTMEVKMKLADGDFVVASILTTQLPKNHVYRTAFMWGGDEFEPPRRIVQFIKLVRNKRDLYVPLSAYADLGDPDRIALGSLHGHGFRLTIIGGDAAGSYRAYLDFRKNEIVSRKVVSGEFPKEAWEETNYSFNHLDN